MQTISATDLARNTRQALDLVSGSGETFMVERNNNVIAQLAAPPKSMTAAQALSGLHLPTLTPAQAKAWLRDSKADFDYGLHDPWA